MMLNHLIVIVQNIAFTHISLIFLLVIFLIINNVIIISNLAIEMVT